MRTTNPIAKLFGRSPFGPTKEHMQTVEACATETIPLFEALLAGDKDSLVTAKERIFELENAADAIKNDIRAHLPKSMFMPVDRRDLLDLLHAQDSIADTAQDVAGLLVMRRFEIPGFMRDRLLPYVQRNLDAVHQCDRIINELDELLEMGFRGRAVDMVESMVEELGDIESETDDQGMALTTDLFAHEDDLKPLSVVFWFQLIELIGDIADYAEDVGDRLRLLIAR